MGLKHTSTHVVSTDSQWSVIHATILTVSATCVLLATGCFNKPKYFVGLNPEFPRAEGESQVDTLRPTFRWESFPRAKDLEELDPHGAGRIASVSYELRLWQVGKEFSEKLTTSDYKYWWHHKCRDTDPGELVYTKQGLVTPEHNLEVSLQPQSRYFWTVRAHFMLDGKRRITEWSEELHHYAESRGKDEGSVEFCHAPATFHLFQTP